jgi:microcystin-dependent protein
MSKRVPSMLVSAVLLVSVVSAGVASGHGYTVVAGEVRIWGGAIADIPNEWFFCDGSEVSRTKYPQLFAAIGTIYGAGNGSTTFNLPDFRNRSPIGATQDDAGVPKTNVSGSLMQFGGEAAHTLTVAEMPAHSHSGAASVSSNAETGGPPNVGTTSTTSTGTTGGGGSHNNLHPYFASTFIIGKESSPVFAPALGHAGLWVMASVLLGTGAVAIVRYRRIGAPA